MVPAYLVAHLESLSGNGDDGVCNGASEVSLGSLLGKTTEETSSGD